MIFAIAALVAASTPQIPSSRALRVVAVGTSLTARGGWTEELRYSLDRRLDRRVSMVVLASPGANSRNLKRMVPHIIKARPDIVLVEYAVNDAKLITGLPMEESINNLKAMVQKVREIFPRSQMVIMAMNPVSRLQRFYRYRLNSYYDAHLKLARDLKLQTLDHRIAWAKIPPSMRAQAIPDGLHPKGSIASRVIVPPLADLITLYVSKDNP